MYRLSILALVGLSACASAGGGGSAITSRPDQAGTITVGSGVALSSMASSSAIGATVAQPLAAVWRVLPAVFDSLGIPIGTVDPAHHVIGNTGFKVRHRLRGTPLSRYIDCGQAQAQSSADSYDVQLSVLTQAQDAGASGTTLTTTIEASARPIEFSGDYSPCSSNSVLEPLIAKMATARLKAAAP